MVKTKQKPSHSNARGRGRPRTGARGEKLYVRSVRFSDSEWAWVNQQAEAEGVSANLWIRSHITGLDRV